MARIQIYDTPQVAPNGLPAVTQNLRMSDRDAADISGATALTNLAEGVQGLSQAAIQYQDRADDAKVLEQTSVLNRAVAGHHVELSKVEGANAEEISKKNRDFWQRYRSESTKDLSPAQRTKFKNVLDRAEAASYESALKEQVAKENAYFEASVESTYRSARDAAALDPLNTDLLALQTGTTKTAIKRYIERKGLKGEVADQYAREQMAAFHATVVQAMIEKDANAAKGYYYTNIREIDSKTRASLENALKVGGRAQMAQEIVDELYSKHGRDGEAAALDAIRARLSGEDEEAAVQLAQSRWGSARRLHKEDQTRLFEKLEGEIDRRGPGVLAALQRSPEYQALDDEHRNALFDVARTRTRELRADARAAQGSATEKRMAEQSAIYEQLATLAQTDPKAFADIDLNLQGAKLTSDMRKDLKEVQSNLRQGGAKALTEDQMLTVGAELAKATGIKGSGLFAFRAALREEIGVESSQTGKAPSRERVRQIAQELLTEGTNEIRFWPDKNVRRFNADPERPFIRKDGAKGAKLLSDVPEAEREEITQALRQRGRPVTSQNIIDLYNAGSAN